VVSIVNEQDIESAEKKVLKQILNKSDFARLNKKQPMQNKLAKGPVERTFNTLSDDSRLKKPDSQLTIFSHLSPVKPTVAYNIYWRFAAERQKIFFNRVKRGTSPWTADSILSKYKFTNAYRASDRVSQYLIKNVIYKGDSTPSEVFFRIMLFKSFNKIETWKLLESKFGEIRYSDYLFSEYEKVLSKAMNEQKRIYSAAYIMTSGKSSFGYERKHQNHLKLIEKMMQDDLAAKIVDLKTMGGLFKLLKSYPTIGDFLAYQYAIDINYSELINFSESEFVIPGPGALSGIKKCFSDLGGLNQAEIIKYVTDIQNSEFERLGISFDSLWGRSLQLIDCQNLFCEVDKYLRVSNPDILGSTNRTKIKQKFRPNSNMISYWYPPKWGLNQLISKDEANRC
jgi:hypothetical protein